VIKNNHGGNLPQWAVTLGGKKGESARSKNNQELLQGTKGGRSRGVEELKSMTAKHKFTRKFQGVVGRGPVRKNGGGKGFRRKPMIGK